MGSLFIKILNFDTRLKATHHFDAFLKLVINEKRQVFWGKGLEVQEILKVSCHRLLKDFIIAEGLSDKVIILGLEVEKALPKSKFLKRHSSQTSK